MSTLTRKLPLLFALILATTLSYSVNAAIPPVLNFSDLISGPSTGLGDGKGSGVIVTIWGQNLGSSQGSSTLTFIDSEGKEKPVAHIYYWKNADGQLPSGPANLYKSHKMQEIAFSIPNSVMGLSTIKLKTSYGESTLPFEIRSGKIYHVSNLGSDETGTGTFENPWGTVSKADAISPSGSTLYIHNVLTGSEMTDQAIYNNSSNSSLDSQFAYISYPGKFAEAWGYRGVSAYAGQNTPTGQVTSKLKVYSSEADEDENGQPVNVRAQYSFGIEGTTHGRAVGNYLTDTHPIDANGGCPDGQQAAITANKKRVENFKILGNHIEEYGCNGTNYQHHTTYLSIRDTNNPQLIAPEMGWNFLENNSAKNGLHYFDEDLSGGNNCGQFTTTFKVHNNVVVNQGGAGLFNGARCNVNTRFEYTNNLLINVALNTSHDGLGNDGKYLDTAAISLSPGEAQSSTLIFKNNTVYKWNTNRRGNDVDTCLGFHSRADNINLIWSHNICYQEHDRKFIRSDYQGSQLENNIVGSNNSWFTTVATPKLALRPSWDNSANLDDPLIVVEDSSLRIQSNSPLLSSGSISTERDIYGIPLSKSTIGSVTYFKPPALYPSNFKGTKIINQ